MKSAINLLLVVVVCWLSLCQAQTSAASNELQSIDYHAMIGGPLQQVITAQAQSSATTVAFIEQVGLEKDRRVRNLEFRYNVTNSKTGLRDEMGIQIPLLSILPIPVLRIAECTIEFNAKITSMQGRSLSFGADLEVGGTVGGGAGVFAVSMSASFGIQTKLANSNEEKREFSMRVFVKARQPELPVGMARLIGVLEEAILIDVTRQFTK